MCFWGHPTEAVTSESDPISDWGEPVAGAITLGCRTNLNKLLRLRLRGSLDCGLGQLHWLLVHRGLGLSHDLGHLLRILRLSLHHGLGLGLGIVVHARVAIERLRGSLGEVRAELLLGLGLHLVVLGLGHHLWGLWLGRLLVHTRLSELLLLRWELLGLCLRVEVSLSHLLRLRLRLRGLDGLSRDLG